MDNRPDRFDEALDNTLYRYGQAPEIPGLHQRVLQRIAARNPRTTRIRSATLALCAAAAALLCFFRWPPAPVATVRAVPSTRIASAPPKAELPNRPIRVKRMRITRRAPKLPQFPAPIPMRAEDRALLRLATQHRAASPLEPVSMDAAIKPIELTAIEIKPL